MHKSQIAFLAALMISAFHMFAQQSFQTGASMSDRDKAGLRGPVRTVVDEQIFSPPDRQPIVTTSTTEYSQDGRILEVRTGNADGSEWVWTYSYSSAGRLLKVSSGKSGTKPSIETTYLYDQAGKLLEERSGDGRQIRYQYDDKGHKSVVETYSSEPLRSNTAYAPQWDGSEMGFVPYPGSSLTTTYNDQDIATGAELHDSEGKLLGHIVRTFDTNGRAISEQQTADAPELMVPEELRANLNPEQLKAVGAFMAGGLLNRSIAYKYDARGRVVEKRRSGGAFGEDVIVTTYNDYGDKTSESTTMIRNPDADREYGLTAAGALIPTGQAPPAQPPVISAAQYIYEYDSHGNWTEQTAMYRSSPEDPVTPGVTHRRKLTYY